MRELTAMRNLDDSLKVADDELHFWGRERRKDRPPNGWYTENTVERAIRGPKSTGPVEVSERFLTIDAAVAKCTELERAVLTVYYVRFVGAGKAFMRRRLNMSEGKWDRTLRRARVTVASFL